jgi:ubiquinone/menaquinone biosynthesis C-methylase UbiE
MEATSKAILHWNEMGRTRQWSALYSDHIDSRNVHVVTRKLRTLQMLASEKPGAMLDIGCGPGILVKEVLEMGYRFAGMDLADEMLKEGRERWGENDRISFRVGDVEKIPAPDGSFEALTCLGVVEYLQDFPAAIREMKRVLKPGGVAIVSNHNRVHVDAVALKIIAPLRLLALPLVRQVKKSKPDDLKRLLLQPKEFDACMQAEGFELDGFAYYHYTPMSYPFHVLMPNLSYRFNRMFESFYRQRGMGFFAHGYIGKYRKG